MLAMSHKYLLHVVSEGVAKLKSLTLIRLRSDDDESKGYVKRIKAYNLPWSSRRNNSELFTVNLTDTPSEAPVIVARHDDLSRVWRKCEYTWCSVGVYLSTRQVSSF